jgi:hypothetical protein
LKEALSGYENKDKPVVEKVLAGKEWLSQQAAYSNFCRTFEMMRGGKNEKTKITEHGNPVDLFNWVFSFFEFLDDRINEEAPQEKDNLDRPVRDGVCERLLDRVVQVPRLLYYVRVGRENEVIDVDGNEEEGPAKKRRKKGEGERGEEEKEEKKGKSELLGKTELFTPVFKLEQRTISVYAGDACVYDKTQDASDNESVPTISAFYMDVPYNLFDVTIDKLGWGGPDVSFLLLCTC